MRIFGVDPGSVHTGYGCIDTSGGRHRILACGALSPPGRSSFPEKLRAIHDGLTALLAEHRPETVAIEDLFYARNARSALKLGHVRGVVMLAAAEAGLPVVEYAPAEVKRAVVGYGRAEKQAGSAAFPPGRDRCTGSGRVPRTLDRAGFGRPAAVRTVRSPVVAAVPAPRRRLTLGTMIAALRGTLAEKQPGRIVVDVGGVGYEVQVPLSTYYTVGECGAEVALRIHTHVREEAFLLFGFRTGLELELFERLIGINGVGPRLALAVLSGIEPPVLVEAIRTADVARLTGIPGVGRKTAERIALELKDKLAAAALADGTDSTHDIDDGDLRGDVISALLNLGYQRPAVERAVSAALKRKPGDFEGALRQALRELSG